MTVLLTSCKPEVPALYYRITTDLETEGQPFQLDVVVQCLGLEVLRSGGGGRLSYTHLPYLYGRPTPAGHAVLLRVPDFCRALDSGAARDKATIQLFKDGGVGLPLVLWMPDKADLDRMTAYTSLKGYDSPGSTLRYRGTRFAEATGAEWQEWMRREGRPFINRSNDPFYSWDENGQRSAHAGKRLPLLCAGLRLKPVPPSFQDEVNRAWPADKPLAWTDEGLWTTFTSEAFRTRRENWDLYPGDMWFVSTQERGFDTLPYEARTVRTYDEPAAAGYRPGSYVTVHRVDLDVTVRGRAECRRGSDAYPNIWLFKRDSQSGRVDRKPFILIGSDYLFTTHTDSRIEVIEGSHEGMFK